MKVAQHFSAGAGDQN